MTGRGYLAYCPKCERDLALYSEDGETWKCQFCKFEIVATDDWIKNIMMQLSEIRTSLQNIESSIKLLAWANGVMKNDT